MPCAHRCADHSCTGASMRTCRQSRSTTRWARKSRPAAKPAPDSRITLAPACRQVTIARTAGSGISSAAGTISTAQRDTHRASARINRASPAPRLASADSYPETDSPRQPCSFKSRRTHLGLASTAKDDRPQPRPRRHRSSGSPAVTAPAAQPRNRLRVRPISEPSRNQPVHRPGGVVKLLIRRIPVARLHFRHQPAVVTHFGHRAADGGPVVVTKKQIRVHALVATTPAFFHHVFNVNSSNSGSVDLNPLFCKPRVVDVADIEMNTHRGAVQVIQKLPELARADEKPVLCVAVLATNPDTGACGFLAKRPESVQAALVHLVVGDFRGHQAGDH